jgi:hypothetical protein
MVTSTRPQFWAPNFAATSGGMNSQTPVSVILGVLRAHYRVDALQF